MDIKKYRQIRALVALFIGLTVSISVTRDSYILAVSAVLIGMLFLALVRSKTKIYIDEREKVVREKAAQITYAIFAPTIGLGSFLLMMLARDQFIFLQSLATVLSYLTLFLIALYSISYYFINRKFGGGVDEE